MKQFAPFLTVHKLLLVSLGRSPILTKTTPKFSLDLKCFVTHVSLLQLNCVIEILL